MLKKILFLIIVIAAAVVIRVYFLGLPGYENDIALFVKWGSQIQQGGFWSLYQQKYFSVVDYPPLIPLLTSWWFALSGGIKFLSQSQVFKVFPTLFELILTAITAVVVWRSCVKYKWPLLAVVILQPGLALVTSAWGQVDSILSLFILLSVLFVNKNNFLSSAFLFLGFLAKPQAVIAVGIYFFYLLARRNVKVFLSQLGFFIGLILLAAGIFKFIGNSNIFIPYWGSLAHYTNLSLYAFNVWWLKFGMNSWAIHDTEKFVISYKAIGLILWTIFQVPALLYLWRGHKKVSEVLLVVSYSYLTFFLFPTEIHERYLFPAVALMGIAALLNRKIFWSYIILSVTLLVNNFAVLQSVYPQFAFLKFNLMTGSWTYTIAVANLAVGIFLAGYLLYESLNHEN